MGRNRRTSTHHAIRTIDKDRNIGSYVHGTTWCGEVWGMSASVSNAAEGEDPLAYSRRSTNCPACAQAIGKARMTQIRDRVRIEAASKEEMSGNYGRNYRGLYRLFIDGTHRGWIVMQNGWGNPWELHQLTTDTSWRVYGSCVSDKPGDYSKVDLDRVFQMVHFYSKDMMASAALRLFDRDPRNLPTVPEMEEAKAADRAKRQQEEADRQERMRLAGIERDRKDGLRAERRSTAIAGLEEIAKRADLSNIELAGLTAALDIINGKDVA